MALGVDNRCALRGARRLRHSHGLTPDATHRGMCSHCDSVRCDTWRRRVRPPMTCNAIRPGYHDLPPRCGRIDNHDGPHRSSEGIVADGPC